MAHKFPISFLYKHYRNLNGENDSMDPVSLLLARLHGGYLKIFTQQLNNFKITIKRERILLALSAFIESL